MESSRKSNICKRCKSGLDPETTIHSHKEFNIPLCDTCQRWYRKQINGHKDHAIPLYLALLKLKVPAELEKDDGFKRIDIVVTRAMLNIEVDGDQHYLDPQQAFTDLLRTYHSHLKGFITLRIPNSLVKHKLDSTAKYIAAMVRDKI